MMLIGSEFKRIRVSNIIGAIPLEEKRSPMIIGNGVFQITGKITLTGQLPVGSAARVRFITEKQTENQVPINASFLVNTLRNGRIRELNVDFTISLDAANGRSLFFQGEIRERRRTSPVPCRFDGHIDQIG